MISEKSVLILITFAISCNGFWWNTPQQQQIQPQTDPNFKQMPVGYFRTYTYQPLTFTPQSYSPIHTYQVSSRIFPNTLPINWQRQSPPSSQPSGLNNFMLPQPSAPVPTAQAPPQNTSPPSPPPPLTTSQIMQPLNEYPPQSQSAQFSMPTSQTSQMSQMNSNFMKPSYVQDPINLQYITNVAPLNVQHVQFVPCMCPVTVTVSGTDLADKRVDEMVASDSNDSVSVVSADEKS